MNESWLLSRLVKTYERWMPDELKNAINDPDAFGNRPRTLRNKEPFPLYVTIYGWDLKKRNPGIPQRDWVWWSGFVVTVVQLGISSIPFALYGYWSVFLITACGSTLALAFSAIPGLTTLPQARAGKRPVALTSLRENGNGHQHVIIILGNEAGLDLLRLASNQLHVTTTVKVVRLMIGTLWILLLITSTAIQTRTWYLVGVGFLGMSHNLFLSAVPRQPKALGMPIQLKRWCNGDEETTIEAGYPRGEAQIIAEETTMFTLMRLELRYPRFGSLLVREIFPGRLSTWEDEWWTSYDKKERERILAAKIKEFINAKIRTRTIVID